MPASALLSASTFLPCSSITCNKEGKGREGGRERRRNIERKAGREGGREGQREKEAGREGGREGKRGREGRREKEGVGIITELSLVCKYNSLSNAILISSSDHLVGPPNF